MRSSREEALSGIRVLDLCRVVSGPFATMQDAEAMKVRLTGEGYNPIVKRT